MTCRQSLACVRECAAAVRHCNGDGAEAELVEEGFLYDRFVGRRARVSLGHGRGTGEACNESRAAGHGQQYLYQETASIIKPSFFEETANVPHGRPPDLRACRMASPINFCTVLFIGRAPRAL